jgi:hypothetical protein
MNFDPLDFNRKLFSEWEKKLAEFLDKRMRDPDFMNIVGKGMGATMDAKSQFDQRMEEWFRKLQLPTKTDLERIWVTLNMIETRVIDIEDRVSAIEEKLAGTAAPQLPAGTVIGADPGAKAKRSRRSAK